MSSGNDAPSYCCISHAFFAAAKSNLHNIAVVHVAGTPSSTSSEIGDPQKLIDVNQSQSYECDTVFSYAEVLSAVLWLSGRLRNASTAINNVGESNERGYKPKIIGVYMAPSVEYIVSVLTVLRCGEAFLPLDPGWPVDRVLSIISSSGTDLVITSQWPVAGLKDDEVSSFESISQSGRYDLLCFSMKDVVDTEEGGDGAAYDMEWPCNMDVKRMFCYLMYTSGSTGVPKGVCGTEQGLLNRFFWMQKMFPLSINDVILFKTSVGFVDHLQEFLSAMLTGCKVVVSPFYDQKEDPFTLVSVVQDYMVSRITIVPSLMKALLPRIESHTIMAIQRCLKLLILSGEVFSLSLWDTLSKLFPETTILNLYGSTEVSGDCTYFDCNKLPEILEKEVIQSVPIGVPISNCIVDLVGEPEKPDEGEIIVSGLCNSSGYWMKGNILPYDQNGADSILSHEDPNNMFYRTGDLARRLTSGDLLFLGRNDRVIKVNGQRVALEEIEYTLRGYSDVADAAVVSYGNSGERIFIEAFLLLKDKEKWGELSSSKLKHWMAQKVPLALIPNQFIIVDSFPVTSSGKVNYSLLTRPDSSCKTMEPGKSYDTSEDLLESIKKAFSDVLGTKEFFDNDDFFEQGGNSIVAAQAAYNLKINVKMIYEFSTPSNLYTAILEKKMNFIEYKRKGSFNDLSSSSSTLWCEPSLRHDNDETSFIKRFKIDMDDYGLSGSLKNSDLHWSSLSLLSCSFSRGNKTTYGKEPSHLTPVILSPLQFKDENNAMKNSWKTHLDSCVDASPLIVIKGKHIYLFIGSHSKKFICSYAKSGAVKWEAVLDGRIECSAAVLGDYSQVIVGCYMGKLYFLDFETGKLCWTFQTNGEVKCQPIIDLPRNLVWCGSHDHFLYALDYTNHCCLHKLDCGGSVFGSPAIDEPRNLLFVGSTSGRVTALSVKDSIFHISWLKELKVPIFGSLCVTLGTAICCLVDGTIVALNIKGEVLWKNNVDGPVFGGPCTTSLLPFQVIICSRNGSAYSLDMESGFILWKYHVGDPITSSAYVNEHILLSSDSSLSPARLICICTNPGRIHLLCLRLNSSKQKDHSATFVVDKFATWDLPGDAFSSPVMIGNRIFVGCRDDYVHCIEISKIPLPD